MTSRTVISALKAWNPAAKEWVTLPVGTVARNVHIGFNKKLGAEGALNPYTAEFEIDSGQYVCPLHTFQARTEAIVDSLVLAERSS